MRLGALCAANILNAEREQLRWLTDALNNRTTWAFSIQHEESNLCTFESDFIPHLITAIKIRLTKIDEKLTQLGIEV